MNEELLKLAYQSLKCQFDNISKDITIEWLRLEFYKCNHAKYRKYADEWLNNLTDAQIEGFENQRIGQIDKSKCV